MYIVVYEARDALRRTVFLPMPKCWDELAQADKAAKDQAAFSKMRAWVYEIPKPDLLELVKS